MLYSRVRARVLGVVLLACALAGYAFAQPACPDAGTVYDQLRVGQFGSSGFAGQIDPGSRFGGAVASLGDLDGDGIADLAVGAYADDDGGTNRGAVWILFMNANGSVKGHQKISATAGGFTGTLDNSDNFGASVAHLGDVDADGVADIAVGAWNDDDGGTDRGAVWILFLNPNGTVKAHQKISATQGGFTGVLDNSDCFGVSIVNLGSLDGDAVTAIAVGAHRDDDGGTDRGAVWILFLNSDGTVKAHQKLSDTEGGFTGVLDNNDLFGCSIAFLGDLNGDSVPDIAVGAQGDDDGGTDRGAVWVLFLNPNGTVLSHAKISDLFGGLAATLDNNDLFGVSVANLGDLDGDGITDFAVGAMRDGDGGTNRGAVYVLFMSANGSVKGEQKISQTAGGFGDLLRNNTNLGGRGVASLGDLDGDGRVELAVGAYSQDDPAYPGDVWLLSVNSCGLLPSTTQQPASVVLTFPGGIAQFSVAVEGTAPLVYQWRRDGVDLVDGGNIAGANTPTLTVFASVWDVGAYDCRVTNSFGQVTSAAAVLAVTPNPCPADINGDGVVNQADLAALLATYNLSCP